MEYSLSVKRDGESWPAKWIVTLHRADSHRVVIGRALTIRQAMLDAGKYLGENETLEQWIMKQGEV